MGHDEGFTRFVEARGPHLLRFAYLLTLDRDSADDLVQSTLARLYPRWTSVSSLQSPNAYAKKAVLNQFLSWRRRPTRSQRHLLIDADIPDQRDSIGILAERDELWRLVTCLPKRERAALVLRFYEDLDDVEIAEIMGCSIGTVRSHVSRAVAKLRTELSSPGPAMRGGRRARLGR